MPRSREASAGIESSWKESFLERLNRAQRRCSEWFESALDEAVEGVFGELESFLGANGFRVSRPLREPGRRSYKFELAENAYVLFIFRFCAVGEFELRTEIFVPGCEPRLETRNFSIADLKPEWAADRFQRALDEFVEVLSGQSVRKDEPALV